MSGPHFTIYPVRYRDRFGEELTSLLNDGSQLSLTLRGIPFQGREFNNLQPGDNVDPKLLLSFALSVDGLCDCTIETAIPIPLITPTDLVERRLGVTVELGHPVTGGGLNRQKLTLGLELDGQAFVSRGATDWFEDELKDLQARLPPGTFVRTCINCAFSDYNPMGHFSFGDLACFRGNKSAYRAVSTKRELFAVWCARTEMVQETHSCPEFERRMPGAGYRG